MSQPVPAGPPADRNLLFGILAVQMDFVSRDALIAAMNAWVLAKHRPLGDILVEQGALTSHRRQVLDLVTAEHLEAHGDDVQRSLAAVGVPSTLHGGLESLADGELQATLAAATQPPTVAERPAADGTRFQVLRPHATGGLGVVSVARDTELGREVALKEIQLGYAADAASRGRFVREAEITGGLEHPGVVPVYGLGKYADGRPYYAMRLVRGETLQEAARKLHAGEPGHTLRGLLTRFVAVCNAVGYAHSRGVLHRDLKPANVMLGPYGETLVVDWGLAKVVGRDRADSTSGEQTLQPPSGEGSLTQAGSALGTPSFMSPEQARGEVNAPGPATDVYSLGATLYAVLAGQAPVRGRDTAEILEKVRQGNWPPPHEVKPSVPRALDAVCRKAMALKPEDRYGSALELAADVERWLADEPVKAWREPWPTRARRWARRHRTVVVGAAAAALVALFAGAAGLLWWQHEQALRRQEQDRRLAAADAALQRVGDLLARGRWAEARAALEQAEDRLAGTGTGELQRRAEEARRNLELVSRLDDIRQKSVTRFVSAQAVIDPAVTDRDYEVAFADARIGVPGREPEVVAGRVAKSPVREALVATLDDWARVAPGERRAWALEVARRADPHPWRDRLRDPAAWEDAKALAKLARQTRVEDVTPGLAAVVGERLAALEEGVEFLRAAQAVWPSDFWLNYNLANALGAQRRYAESEGYCRAALAVRPDIAAPYYILGMDLEGQGKKDEAFALYAKAFELYPKPPGMKPEVAWAWGIGNFGEMWQRLGKLDDAAAFCRKAIEAEPGNPIGHSSLGWVLARQGKSEEATGCYRKAVELDPKNVDAREKLCQSLERQGNWETAATLYREALGGNPKDARARSGLAALLQRHDKWPEAVALYRKALEDDPKDANARVELANSLAGQGKLGEAESEFRRTLQQRPGDIVAIQGLGKVLKRQDRSKEFEEFCRQSLAKNPTDDFTRQQLTNLLASQQRFDEAEAVYRKRADEHPEDANARNNLGWFLQGIGRYDEATSVFRKSFELNPKDQNARLMFGWLLRQQDKWEEAADLYRQALEENPKDNFRRSELAQSLEGQGKWEEAAALFEKALEQNPRDTSTRYSLAGSLERRGKPDAAADIYRKVLHENPKDYGAWIFLVSVLEHQGKSREAITLCRKAVEEDPKAADAFKRLGRLLERQGKFDEAAASYRKVVEIDQKAHDSGERGTQWIVTGDGVLIQNSSSTYDAGRLPQVLLALSRVLLASAQYPQATDSARSVLPYLTDDDDDARTLAATYERLAGLGGRLPAVLRGEGSPASAAEGLDFAELCWLQRRYADAVRLTSEAFTRDPKLANDLKNSRRFKAACHAASAGCPGGDGAAEPGDADRARLRLQAREWLRADLTACRELAGSRAHRPEAFLHLQGWQWNEDLYGVREGIGLAQLPEPERKEWQAFWAEVKAVLTNPPAK